MLIVANSSCCLECQLQWWFFTIYIRADSQTLQGSLVSAHAWGPISFKFESSLSLSCSLGSQSVSQLSNVAELLSSR